MFILDVIPVCVLIFTVVWLSLGDGRWWWWVVMVGGGSSDGVALVMVVWWWL